MRIAADITGLRSGINADGDHKILLPKRSLKVYGRTYTEQTWKGEVDIES